MSFIYITNALSLIVGLLLGYYFGVEHVAIYTACLFVALFSLFSEETRGTSGSLGMFVLIGIPLIVLDLGLWLGILIYWATRL